MDRCIPARRVVEGKRARLAAVSLHGVANESNVFSFPPIGDAPRRVAGQVDHAKLNVIAEIYDLVVFKLAVYGPMGQ